MVVAVRATEVFAPFGIQLGRVRQRARGTNHDPEEAKGNVPGEKRRKTDVVMGHGDCAR
jgi:hypothetical protein